MMVSWLTLPFPSLSLENLKGDLIFINTRTINFYHNTPFKNNMWCVRLKEPRLVRTVFLQKIEKSGYTSSSRKAVWRNKNKKFKNCYHTNERVYNGNVHVKTCSCFPEDMYKVFNIRGSGGQQQIDSSSNDNDGSISMQSPERRNDMTSLQQQLMSKHLLHSIS